MIAFVFRLNFCINDIQRVPSCVLFFPLTFVTLLGTAGALTCHSFDPQEASTSFRTPSLHQLFCVLDAKGPRGPLLLELGL